MRRSDKQRFVRAADRPVKTRVDTRRAIYKNEVERIFDSSNKLPKRRRRQPFTDVRGRLRQKIKTGSVLLQKRLIYMALVVNNVRHIVNHAAFHTHNDVKII